MATRIDKQLVGRDALCGEAVDLLQDIARVNDHARADDVYAVRIQDARGDELKFVFGAVHDNRVAGIVAALAADDQIGFGRKNIDELALAFVAPLSAQNYFARHEKFCPFQMNSENCCVTSLVPDTHKGIIPCFPTVFNYWRQKMWVTQL